jgi:hypothetical protein
MTKRPIPSVWHLSPDVREGRRCVWCATALGEDAVPAGMARGYWGAHDRSVRVDSCPACAEAS